MHIVLVDDTPEHLELLREFLGELRPEARVTTLQDGRHLVEHLRKQPADLVMVDLLMPRINGYDLVQQLRAVEYCAETPVVAVSGLRQPDHESELHALGFTDYIVKPYEITDLLRILDRHLPG